MSSENVFNNDLVEINRCAYVRLSSEVVYIDRLGDTFRICYISNKFPNVEEATEMVKTDAFWQFTWKREPCISLSCILKVSPKNVTFTSKCWSHFHERSIPLDNSTGLQTNVLLNILTVMLAQCFTKIPGYQLSISKSHYPVIFI